METKIFVSKKFPSFSRINIYLRAVSFVVLISFTFTNSFVTPSYATAIALPSANDQRSLPGDLALIKIPDQIGKIQEVYKGKGQEVIILVQDAHAIPDAQRNIQKIIHHFQNRYGLNLIALEGASSELDSQFFKSFPDQEVLKKTFEQYFERGELTGGAAAAILNENPSLYFGVEDWALYEEGLGLYLQASQKEQLIIEKINVSKKELQKQKKFIYSKELLELDRVLEDFHANHNSLIDVLKLLAGIKAPEKGSELALLLEEASRDHESRSGIEAEVKKIALEIKTSLESLHKNQEDLTFFNRKFQEFQTSQITPEAFALFIKELTAKENFPIQVSDKLTYLMKNQKRMRDIEGIRLFQNFERYVRLVKESLLKNEEQKRLDQETHRLELVERLAHLELNREDWNEIKAKSLDPQFAEILGSHIAFYKNSEKRDGAFFKNLISHLQKNKSKSSLFVAGGFHTEGLTQRLKERKISYVLLTPSIGSIPEHSHYQEHMRGEVSWKNYFQAENGQVNLYKAFVRGTRDKLLKESKGQPNEVLKSWRDQIIRDLAQKGKITEVNQFTSFIDEVVRKDQESRPQWEIKIEQFIDGLRKFDSQGQLTESNIMKLFGPATVLQAAGGNASDAPGSVLPVDYFSSIIFSRSEVRSLLEGLSPDKKKLVLAAIQQPLTDYLEKRLHRKLEASPLPIETIEKLAENPSLFEDPGKLNQSISAKPPLKKGQATQFLNAIQGMIRDGRANLKLKEAAGTTKDLNTAYQELEDYYQAQKRQMKWPIKPKRFDLQEPGKMGTPYASLNWRGHQVELVAGPHASLNNVEGILRVVRPILQNPERWFIVFEGAEQLDILNAASPSIEGRFLGKLHRDYKLPVEDPIPSPGNPEVIDLVSRNLHLTREEVIVAIFFRNLHSNFLAARKINAHSQKVMFQNFLSHIKGMHPDPVRLLRRVAEKLINSERERQKFAQMIQEVVRNSSLARNEIAQNRLVEILKRYSDRSNILAVVGRNHAAIFGSPLLRRESTYSDKDVSFVLDELQRAGAIHPDLEPPVLFSDQQSIGQTIVEAAGLQASDNVFAVVQKLNDAIQKLNQEGRISALIFASTAPNNEVAFLQMGREFGRASIADRNALIAILNQTIPRSEMRANKRTHLGIEQLEDRTTPSAFFETLVNPNSDLTAPTTLNSSMNVLTSQSAAPATTSDQTSIANIGEVRRIDTKSGAYTILFLDRYQRYGDDYSVLVFDKATGKMEGTAYYYVPPGTAQTNPSYPPLYHQGQGFEVIYTNSGLKLTVDRTPGVDHPAPLAINPGNANRPSNALTYEIRHENGKDIFIAGTNAKYEISRTEFPENSIQGVSIVEDNFVIDLTGNRIAYYAPGYQAIPLIVQGESFIDSKTHFAGEFDKLVTIRTRATNGMILEHVIYIPNDRPALVSTAVTLESVPNGWTRAASNPNYAFQEGYPDSHGRPPVQKILYLRNLQTGATQEIVRVNTNQPSYYDFFADYDVSPEKTPGGPVVVYTRGTVGAWSGSVLENTVIQRVQNAAERVVITDGISNTQGGPRLSVIFNNDGTMTVKRVNRFFDGPSSNDIDFAGTKIENTYQISLQTLKVSVPVSKILSRGTVLHIDLDTPLVMLEAADQPSLGSSLPNPKTAGVFIYDASNGLDQLHALNGIVFDDGTRGYRRNHFKLDDAYTTPSGRQVVSVGLEVEIPKNPSDYQFTNTYIIRMSVIVNPRTGQELRLDGTVTAVTYNGKFGTYNVVNQTGQTKQVTVNLETLQVVPPVPDGWTRAASDDNSAFRIIVSKKSPGAQKLQHLNLLTGHITTVKVIDRTSLKSGVRFIDLENVTYGRPDVIQGVVIYELEIQERHHGREIIYNRDIIFQQLQDAAKHFSLPGYRSLRPLNGTSIKNINLLEGNQLLRIETISKTAVLNLKTMKELPVPLSVGQVALNLNKTAPMGLSPVDVDKVFSSGSPTEGFLNPIIVLFAAGLAQEEKKKTNIFRSELRQVIEIVVDKKTINEEARLHSAHFVVSAIDSEGLLNFGNHLLQEARDLKQISILEGPAPANIQTSYVEAISHLGKVVSEVAESITPEQKVTLARRISSSSENIEATDNPFVGTYILTGEARGKKQSYINSLSRRGIHVTTRANLEGYHVDKITQGILPLIQNDGAEYSGKNKDEVLSIGAKNELSSMSDIERYFVAKYLQTVQEVLAVATALSKESKEKILGRLRTGDFEGLNPQVIKLLEAVRLKEYEAKIGNVFVVENGQVLLSPLALKFDLDRRTQERIAVAA